MSVYRDTNSSVTFEHPFAGPLVATVYRGIEPILVSDPIVSNAGRFTVDLTYRETQFDGQLDIVWTGTDNGDVFTRKTSVDVITPLVPISRLQTLFTDTNWTPTELAELENSVRVFIQNYTHQAFGYEIGTYTVVGNGEQKVALPKRLIKATSIEGGGPPTYYAVSADGWHLYINNKNWLTIKEVPPEEFVDNVQIVSGVIYVPDIYWNQFRKGARYDVVGEWGWYSVPEDVQEAAMILANDFACGDSLYRDRFVKAAKYADVNIGYDAGAFRGTGNAKADQLLSPYRKQNMVII